jgi:hypothetical protein
MLKTATKWVSRTLGKSGFGFYMCKIKGEKNPNFLRPTDRKAANGFKSFVFT